MARKIKRLKPSSERDQRALDNARAQRGLDRKSFFEEGGEMVRWRGLHFVQPDKKKKKNKHTCRGRIRL
jgi:hypothetical protein